MQAGTPQDQAAYPPLDTLKPVAPDIWIVDGAPIHPGGVPMPVRMTVIRLASGDLFLHSPIRHSPELQTEISRLGPIRHLVAPSFGHWMFLKAWQDANPKAI